MTLEVRGLNIGIPIYYDDHVTKTNNGFKTFSFLTMVFLCWLLLLGWPGQASCEVTQLFRSWNPETNRVHFQEPKEEAQRPNQRQDHFFF